MAKCFPTISPFPIPHPVTQAKHCVATKGPNPNNLVYRFTLVASISSSWSSSFHFHLHVIQCIFLLDERWKTCYFYKLSSLNVAFCFSPQYLAAAETYDLISEVIKVQQLAYWTAIDFPQQKRIMDSEEHL